MMIILIIIIIIIAIVVIIIMMIYIYIYIDMSFRWNNTHPTAFRSIPTLLVFIGSFLGLATKAPRSLGLF